MGSITKLLGGLSLLLGLLLWLSVRDGVRLRTERRRLTANQSALLDSCHSYRVRDSLNAVSVRTLTLKTEEFRRHFGQQEQLIKELGLQLRRVESLSQHSISSHYTLSTPVYDTLVEHNAESGTSSPSSAESDLTGPPLPQLLAAGQAIRYRDPHLKLDGLILNGQFTGTIETYDTLTQIVHRIPHRFLFFRWGTKELRQEILSSNPHSRIVYSRFLRIERRRREDKANAY